jgi:hypothetical protein
MHDGNEKNAEQSTAGSKAPQEMLNVQRGCTTSAQKALRGSVPVDPEVPEVPEVDPVPTWPEEVDRPDPIAPRGNRGCDCPHPSQQVAINIQEKGRVWQVDLKLIAPYSGPDEATVAGDERLRLPFLSPRPARQRYRSRVTKPPTWRCVVG